MFVYFVLCVCDVCCCVYFHFSCSSLGGALTELGSHFVNTDGKTLRQNHWNWNKVANVMFIDSPLNTGFSYSKLAEDQNTGDIQTAQDMVQFILQFYQHYPEYQGRELHLLGESFGKIKHVHFHIHKQNTLIQYV